MKTCKWSISVWNNLLSFPFFMFNPQDTSVRHRGYLIFNVEVLFCLRFLFRGLSGSNFVYKILSADCREAISYAKFFQRVVGRQFRMQNSVSGLSGSNFVCKILSADCREAILCAKFCKNGRSGYNCNVSSTNSR